MKKFTVIFHLLFAGCCISIATYAQPSLQKQGSFGGSQNDNAYGIQQTTDDGYIIAGFTASFNGDVHGNHGDEDFWVVKLNKNGSIKWEKALGGSGDEKAFSVQQTNDGGFIVAGEASSFNGQVTGNHGMLDFWVVKLDADGNIAWQKSLGGSKNDFANSIQQTSDGGYIVAGGSFSDDGDVEFHHGYSIYPDYWILKLTGTGDIEWKKVYGGTKGDIAMSIRQTVDGGYIVAGNSASNDGDVRGTHDIVCGDFWILKLDAQGNLRWAQTFGGSDYEQANSIIQTADGGYIAAGWSRSPNTGDVTGNHGNYDVWVVKMNATGLGQWQKSLGGSEGDLGLSIRQTPDNGYVIAGSTSSNNADVSGNHGKEDFWIVKIAGNGRLEWQKTLGGSEYEEARSIALTKDGGYIMAGFSGFVNVNNGDVTGNHGGYDFWITKLSATVIAGAVQQQEGVQQQGLSKPVLQISPNPVSSFLSVNTSFLHANFQLTIVNNSGQAVIEKSIKEQGFYAEKIDVSTLAAGIYFIILRSGDNVAMKKFVKKE